MNKFDHQNCCVFYIHRWVRWVIILLKITWKFHLWWTNLTYEAASVRSLRSPWKKWPYVAGFIRESMLETPELRENGLLPAESELRNDRRMTWVTAGLPLKIGQVTHWNLRWKPILPTKKLETSDLPSSNQPSQLIPHEFPPLFVGIFHRHVWFARWSFRKRVPSEISKRPWWVMTVTPNDGIPWWFTPGLPNG